MVQFVFGINTHWVMHELLAFQSATNNFGRRLSMSARLTRLALSASVKGLGPLGQKWTLASDCYQVFVK